jgi:hypothetical protein
MNRREALLDRIAQDFEDLALRVARTIASFAKQKTSVQLEHYWELERVRRQFAEFKKRLIDLEDSDGLQDWEIHTAVEATWNELVRAVDDLQSTLAAASQYPSRSHLTRDFHHNNLPCKCATPRDMPD